MARNDKRKKRSVKKRKRKGFYGVRPQENANESRNDLSNMDGNPGSLPVLSDIPIPVSTPAVESISSKKLLNTSFEKCDCNSWILTREQAKKVGLGLIPGVEVAKGFKIQDAILVNDCISTAAVCSSCRKAT